MNLPYLRRAVESPQFTRIIMVLIIINAMILGLETYPRIVAAYGGTLEAIDHVILWVFVIELGLRLAVHGLRLFRDPWFLFDMAVVGIAFMPDNEAFGVLRAVRVLRVLRLISIFPRLRRVLGGLVVAIPGIGSIGAILGIIFYVFAVMSTKLFGTTHPELFGSLQDSMFTLFQIMTLEGWGETVRDLAVTHAFAKPFFVVYILIATFTVLNLFIAVIVDAMQRQHLPDEQEEQNSIIRIEAELMRISQKLDAVRK